MNLPNVAKAFSFDADKNLFISDTPIILEYHPKDGKKMEKIEFTQDEHYALEDQHLVGPDKEYRYVNGDVEQSMHYFRIPGNYTRQTIRALDPKYRGPSRPSYEEALMHAFLIAKKTARGQSREELRAGTRLHIYEALSQEQRESLAEHMRQYLGGDATRNQDLLIHEYLNRNYYAPCSNEEYLASINTQLCERMHIKKTRAMADFIPHVIKTYADYKGDLFSPGKPISLGFSDDLTKNVEGMKKFMEEIRHQYPQVKFCVYDTSKPDDIKKTVV